MFSQTVEYALRAVVHLAYVAPQALTTEEIAKITKVPQAYLAKVLQSLVQAQIVKSQRGIGGGMSLAKPTATLTILEVVNAVDPIRRIKTCPLDLQSHGVNLCPLHRKVDDALALVEKAFQITTLDEVITQPNNSVPLCDIGPRK